LWQQFQDVNQLSRDEEAPWVLGVGGDHPCVPVYIAHESSSEVHVCQCKASGKWVGIRFVNILGGEKKFCFWWGDAEIGWGRGKIGGLLRSHRRHQHRWFDHSFSNYTE
jgi:hypothetical protein